MNHQFSYHLALSFDWHYETMIWWYAHHQCFYWFNYLTVLSFYC